VGAPSSSTRVRPATFADGKECAAIYAPNVEETANTFELEPPSATEMAERIAAVSRSYAWLVLEDEEPVVGHAYGARFRGGRVAYGWSCELSVFPRVETLTNALAGSTKAAPTDVSACRVRVQRRAGQVSCRRPHRRLRHA
jgi:hypothetical protein